MVDLDWTKAIAFMQTHQEQNPDHEYVQLIWKKLQLGFRTQDILMDIAAFIGIKQEGATNSPEWQRAMKWLNYQRAQGGNLMLDMLWKQLETGDRTPELLTLIRQAAAQITEPPPPVATPVVLPVAPESVPDVPPSSSF